MCHIKTGKQIQQHGLKMRKKEVKASVGTKERTSLQWTDGIVVVINLQVFLQPVVLLEEEVLAKVEIEVNLGGNGDYVR